MKINKLSFKITCISSLILFLGIMIYTNFLFSPIIFYSLIILVIIISYFLFTILLFDIHKIKDRIYNINKNRFTEAENPDNFENLIERLDLISKQLENDQINFDRISKVRTEFLANVSHELKTPIFAIKGYTETLLNGALEDNNVNRNFIDKIDSQASRLENLFSDLIDISRIESNQLVLELKEFPLNRLLNWVEQTYSLAISNKGINFSIPDCNNIIVYGDEKYLQSVFSNLIENAINYSNSGSIILAAKVDNDNINISITDNGLGIDKEHFDRIFERFYRVDGDRSRDSGGTGLGLSIVKHILESHGSSIDVKSVIGQGSTFSFKLKRILKS